MNRLIRTGILAALGALTCIQLYAQPASFQRAVPVWVNGQQNTPNLTASFRVCIPWNGQSQTQLRLAAHSDYRAYVTGVFLGHGHSVFGDVHSQAVGRAITRGMQGKGAIVAETVQYARTGA